MNLESLIRKNFSKCFWGPLFTSIFLYHFLPFSLLDVLQLFSAHYLSSQSFLVLVPPLLDSSKSEALSGSLPGLYFITTATLSATTIIKKAAALSLEREQHFNSFVWQMHSGKVSDASCQVPIASLYPLVVLLCNSGSEFVWGSLCFALLRKAFGQHSFPLMMENLFQVTAEL